MCKRSGGVASERSPGPEKGSTGVVINPWSKCARSGHGGVSEVCMVGYLVNILECYRYLG